jgi:uncharacterized membrane protein
MPNRHVSRGVGNVLAPWRFLTFLVVAAAGAFLLFPTFGWARGAMSAFDIAALVFLASCLPLLNDETGEMRRAAERNDANRAVLLLISVLVTAVIMVAVASELLQPGKPPAGDVALIISSLIASWLFSNTLYALHYAHIFYTRDEDGTDQGGLDFPDTKEPDYWDFVYFSFCLGMTFQTSDVDMTSRAFRRVSTAHCLAAFIFNIGVIAFTINTLGGN